MRYRPPLAVAALAVLVTPGVTVPGPSAQRDLVGTPTCESEHQQVPEDTGDADR